MEKILKRILQQGLDSKPFWNIVLQMKRNYSEVLIAIKDGKGNKLFNEKEIKLHTSNYYHKKLYTKGDSPNCNQQWKNFTNNKVN